MKTFFSIEDIETVFRDGYDRGHHDALNILDVPSNSEFSWNEYKNSNRTVFESKASIQPSSPKPENLKCPECEGEMVIRTNRQSGNKFWGCKKFPVCKGTRDEQGLSKSEREAAKESKPESFQQQEGYSFRKGH